MSEALTGLADIEPQNEETSLLGNTSLSIKDHLKEAFKLRYEIRKIKNRGAILILVWNFLSWSVFSYSSSNAVKETNNNDLALLGGQAVVAGLVMPLAGWLADVRWGRYKVVSWSIWIMWTSSIFITASFILAQLVESYYNIHTYVFVGLLLIMGIGFVGFQANIVQFGVDQLHDASTIEIKSFIAWYTATFLSGRLLLNFFLDCVQKYRLIGPILVNFNTTVVMVTYLLFNSLLIKEPTTKNPFKQVYDVIKYAVKNKYPRMRSAFTYSEDIIPSRIDFGKQKYGGPFTTEQVEDVKTLFRSLLMALVTTAFYGVTYNEDNLVSQLKNTLQIGATDDANNPTYMCYSNNLYFTGAYVLTAALLIPVNETLIYPFFQRRLPYLTIHSKFIIGALLRMGVYVTFIALLTTARQQYIIQHSQTLYNNNTLQCLYHIDSGTLVNTLDSRWFILPQILSSLSDLLIVITMIEFFCAQVPYSMKGLIAGLTYGLLGLFIALNRIILLPFIKVPAHWGVRAISCGFWYLLTKLFLLIVIFSFSLVGRWYKLRKREDVLPNEQIFAERYYSKDH